MRANYLILGLVALVAVIGLVMSRDPEQAGQLSQMYKDAAFTGETRDFVILAIAIGLGGFIAYLTLTRR
jgi:hypothetical protein